MVSGVYAFYDSINCGPTNEGDLRSDSEYVILTIQKIFAFPPGLMARKQMATPMPFNLSLLCQQGKFRDFTCAPRGFLRVSMKMHVTFILICAGYPFARWDETVTDDPCHEDAELLGAAEQEGSR